MKFYFGKRLHKISLRFTDPKGAFMHSRTDPTTGVRRHFTIEHEQKIIKKYGVSIGLVFFGFIVVSGANPVYTEVTKTISKD